ncbi:unnamed protein product [Coffea canephora]|uniref:Uncharacterized protein n=1 Tax=Coffea canephora TaxID=49390 RepID=A0A068UWL0_COFCA|nr:unnamed protein product [Coffea canephora]
MRNKLSATPNLADYYPYLRELDLQGLTRRMKAVSKIFDRFLEKIVDEHEQSANQDRQADDFVYTMLAFPDFPNLIHFYFCEGKKCSFQDMLGGSMDTSATVVEWTLAELLKTPRVMKKAQQELEKVVGLDRMVEESDLDSLNYLTWL